MDRGNRSSKDIFDGFFVTGHLRIASKTAKETRTVPSASLTRTAGPSESTKIKQLAVVAETEDIRTTPSRPFLVRQGKLNEAQSAGRDCPGSGAAGPLAAMAWTEIPATAGYTALCLPLLPGVTKLVSH